MKIYSIIISCIILVSCSTNREISTQIDTKLLNQNIELMIEEVIISHLSDKEISPEFKYRYSKLSRNDIITFPELKARLLKLDFLVKLSKEDFIAFDPKIIDESDWIDNGIQAIYFLNKSEIAKSLGFLSLSKNQHEYSNFSDLDIIITSLNEAFKIGINHISTYNLFKNSSLSFKTWVELIKNETIISENIIKLISDILQSELLKNEYENNSNIERVSMAIALIEILKTKRPELDLDARMVKYMKLNKSLIPDLEKDEKGYAQVILSVERLLMELPDGSNFYPHKEISPEESLKAFKILLGHLGL